LLGGEVSLTGKAAEDGSPVTRLPEKAAKERPPLRSFLDSLEDALERLAEQGGSFAQRNGDR
jgi:hypothetical protein